MNTSPHVKALGILLACQAPRLPPSRDAAAGAPHPHTKAPIWLTGASGSSFHACWKRGSPRKQEFLRLLEVQRFALPGDGHPPGAALARGWQPTFADELLLFRWGPAPEPPLALQRPEPAFRSQHQTWQLKLP